jgi:hypothetical protein
VKGANFLEEVRVLGSDGRESVLRFGEGEDEGVLLGYVPGLLCLQLLLESSDGSLGEGGVGGACDC